VHAIDAHFFIHEADRADEAENAIRKQLCGWARHLISTVAADLFMNNIMMTVNDKDEGRSFVQTFKNMAARAGELRRGDGGVGSMPDA
jgi:hypothetical protein